MPQLTFGRALLAFIIAVFSVFGINSIFNIANFTSAADMRIEPGTGTTVVGEQFVVDVIVESSEAVNVFKGLVNFDPRLLKVVAITYNTSIADLWAERPWYSNGDGTLNFIGGTTQPGGFSGTGSLVTVTFESLTTGDTKVQLNDIRILKHDGLGSDADIAKPIDALFAIESPELDQETVLKKDMVEQDVRVLPYVPDTDLNNDGKQNMIDMSIFMADFATQNLRSDFNQDGRVTTADLSIFMNAK